MPKSLLGNPAGSKWHRWDPHLHAPGTLLNDQFQGDWETYFTRVEQSEPRVQALGVTDYFCIQTYRAVRRRVLEHRRLPAVRLLFPNVELRLDIKTAKQKPINLHLLFSPDDPNHEAEIERILSKLTFSVDATEYRCALSEFARLGRAADPAQTDEQAAIKTGVLQFKTTLKDVRNLFKTEKWMRENCLVAVASKSGDGASGLQDDDSFTSTRRDLELFADIILAGNPKQRAFWLGETEGHDRAFIEKTYRALKPCLHGSDAHRCEDVVMPDEGRFCWLKGDLTYETLRQAVIEPRDRVRISVGPPADGNSAEAISRVALFDAPWIAQPFIEINPGLVAIIGARGSGKTALADVIASGASAAALSGAGDASFLRRASEHLGAAAVQITWADDGTSPRTMLTPWYGTDEEPPLVRYLSQHFVEELCSAPGLATHLRREMERVVFESIEASRRLGANSFSELADLYLEPVLSRRAELKEVVSATASAIVYEEERKEKLPALLRDIEATKKQIENDRKALAELLPKDKAVHVARLTALESLCTEATGRVETLRRRQKIISDLKAEVHNIEGFTEPKRHAEMRRRFVGANLQDPAWADFLMRFSGDVSGAIAQLKTTADTAVHLAAEGPLDWHPPVNAQPSADWPLTRLTALRDDARNAVGIDADRQKKYDERQKMLASRELLVQRQAGEAKVAEGSDQRRKTLIESRRDTYRQIVATLIEEEQILRDLYAPVRSRVEGGAGALGKLGFSVRRHVDYARWCETGEALIDLRSATRFKGHGALKKDVEMHLLPAWKTGNADAITGAMDTFRVSVSQDLLAAMPPSIMPDGRLAWQQRLADWLYDTSHITVHYDIEYEGVSIEHLSPGTRGIVLLLLYLAIDRNDSRPLIVDQPEENLDPKSVFAELVPHFREARKRRQIIIVTHNANLVVNTDADQVIVATASRMPGSALPVLSYETGSLENKAIRAAVCDTLEGGEQAFLERERRYRLKWGESLALEAS
jgi:energy-coupling factor transporter ATP-binding protein EcfA2